MDPNASLRNEILASRATRAVVHSDGEGRVLGVWGDGFETRLPSSIDLAEALDLAAAASERFGQSQGFGSAQTAVYFYEKAIVVAGVSRGGANLAVIAEASANVGLLLTQIRRLLAEWVSDRAD